MENIQPTTVCKTCTKYGLESAGMVYVTEEQVETGTTTKKGRWDLCPCCDGDWRDCKKCAENTR